MKIVRMTACSLLLAVSGAATAAVPGYIDFYYVVDSELNPDGGDKAEVEGDRYGLKGSVSLGERFFGSAEYERYEDKQKFDVDGDDNNERVKLESDTFRLGGGIIQPLASRTQAFALVQYLHEKVKGSVRSDTISESASDSQDGYGAFAGLRGENGNLGITVQVGYLDVGDADGFEYEIQADYRIIGNVGVLVNYRVTDLEDDELDLGGKLSNLSVGATYYFGG